MYTTKLNSANNIISDELNTTQVSILILFVRSCVHHLKSPTVGCSFADVLYSLTVCCGICVSVDLCRHLVIRLAVIHRRLRNDEA